MAANYTDLKTEIASFYARTDLTSIVDTFIDMAEAEMQRKLKLVEYETTGTITVTTGTGPLPSGYIGFRSVAWSSSPNRILTYIPPSKLAAIEASTPSYVDWYTITGANVKVQDDQSGTLNVVYLARFPALSGSQTTNFLLTNHPDMYLAGCLKWAALYHKDFEGSVGYGNAFTNLMSQVKLDNIERKFGNDLRVMPA